MELQFWIRVLPLLPALHFGYCIQGTGYSTRWECEHSYGTIMRSLSSVASAMSCAAACEKEELCLSALYNPTSKRCLTNSDTSEFVDQTGTCNPVMKYMEVSKHFCNTIADCPDTTNGECVDNICQCVNGYSLTPATGMCSTSCATYGDTFRVFPSTSMIGHNDDTLWNTTFAACQEACVAKTNFVCRSVEMDITETYSYCRMSFETAYTQPGSISYSQPSWSFAHRNCA